MKKLSLILAITALAISSQAQDRIRDRDVVGEWQLIIDINEHEIMEDIERDDDIPLFGEWIAESVIGVVSNVLDDIEIYFDFRSGGKVKVVAEIFGEREVEYTEWYINDDDELVIGETDVFNHDDEVWIKEGDRLVSYDTWRDRDDDAEVYLVRID